MIEDDEIAAILAKPIEEIEAELLAAGFDPGAVKRNLSERLERAKAQIIAGVDRMRFDA